MRSFKNFDCLKKCSSLKKFSFKFSLCFFNSPSHSILIYIIVLLFPFNIAKCSRRRDCIELGQSSLGLAATTRPSLRRWVGMFLARSSKGFHRVRLRQPDVVGNRPGPDRPEAKQGSACQPIRCSEGNRLSSDTWPRTNWGSEPELSRHSQSSSELLGICLLRKPVSGKYCRNTAE